MTDELTVERASHRITRFALALAAGGTVAAFILGGWKTGAGFAGGSAISWLNFRWLKGIVSSLSGPNPSGGAGVLALRYVLLGGAAYVIVKFIRVSLPAVVAGVFVLTAAVFLEVAFEIAYGRK